MPRLKCIVEYDGTHFVGWQRQLNGRSVQEAIEQAIEKIAEKKITIFGAGRTDTGVHAVHQVFHFDFNKDIDVKKITDALNFHLKNESISILKTELTNADFDSRRDAKLRIYKYVMINRESPLSIEKDRAWQLKIKLDEIKMNDAAQILIGTHDFTTFRSASCGAKSPIKTMEKINIFRKDDYIYSYFESQSFLQHQVRSMMGCIKLVGENKWSKKDLLDALNSKDRSKCGPPAPAAGLYLENIFY
jgi:tRNA pseudouridine38-40 synthase